MHMPRREPVQLAPQPLAHVSSVSSLHKDQMQSNPQPKQTPIFAAQNPGFGSRHAHDKAPFSLWDYKARAFREPLSHEINWMFAEYRARWIHVALPDIIIVTDHPPTETPLTVGVALVRFVSENKYLPSIPAGSLRPYPNRQRADLLSSSLPLYSIPTHQECYEIIRLLESEVDIRAIHFLPPQIIVELDMTSAKKYDRHSLPSRAGGISIQYHEAKEGFWEDLSQTGSESITTPTDIRVDDSSYPSSGRDEMSPGVCLGQSFVVKGDLYSSKYPSTSAGLFLQNNDRKCLTVANHGFPDLSEVHHLSQTNQRMGQITDRFPEWDLAFVQLDSSVLFSNDRYFTAPKPLRLIRVEEIEAGDWFEVDGHSTGRLDMCARGRSYVRPDTLEGTDQEWKAEIVYSLFGANGVSITGGMCGAPVVDREGRVAGMISSVNPSGMWARTLGLNFFIDSGWDVV